MTYEQNRRDLADKMAKEHHGELFYQVDDIDALIELFFPFADIALKFAAEQAEIAYDAALSHVGSYSMKNKKDNYFITHGLKEQTDNDATSS